MLNQMSVAFEQVIQRCWKRKKNVESLSKGVYLKHGIWNLESGIRNPETGIQEKKL